MKTKAFKSILFVLAALLLASGCNDSILSEEVPGQPLFQINADLIDFGRVELNEPYTQQVWVRNLGPQDSKMYVYYYVEGNAAFEVDSPEKEVVLAGSRSSHPIQICYHPQRTGEVQGTLVIYHANRTLTDDINVQTHRVHLIGNAGFKCITPEPSFTQPATKQLTADKNKAIGKGED